MGRGRGHQSAPEPTQRRWLGGRRADRRASADRRRVVLLVVRRSRQLRRELVKGTPESRIASGVRHGYVPPCRFRETRHPNARIAGTPFCRYPPPYAVFPLGYRANKEALLTEQIIQSPSLDYWQSKFSPYPPTRFCF